MRSAVTTACCWMAMLVAASGAMAQALGGERIHTIAQLAGDLYRVQDGDKTTVFLVTSAGIVLVDPLSDETATWLMEEFAARFPGRQVRYVIYTHHHEERASGGLVFKATAAQTAQGRFNGERLAASTTLSPPLVELDQNHDGVLQRNEIAGSPRAAMLVARDQNADGVITSAEVYAHVAKADQGFARQGVITVGQYDLVLTSAPTSYAADMTVIVFRMQRVAFAADLFPVRAVPQKLGPERVTTLIDSMRRVEQLPFDTMLTGDGQTLTRADVTAFREYLEALYSGVRAGRSGGRAVSEIQATLALEKFSQWDNFSSGTRANIAEVYAILKRSSLRLVMGQSYATESPDSCGTGSGCKITGRGMLPVTGGLRLIRQRFTAGVEMQYFPPESAHYPKTFKVVQLQDTVVTVPLGLIIGSAERGLSVTFEGGPAFSRTRSGTTSFELFSESFRPLNKMTAGVSGGALIEWHVTPRVGIVSPIHFIQEGTDATSVPRRRLMAGAGLSVALLRDYR